MRRGSEVVRLCRHGQSLDVNVASVLQITDAVPRAQLAVPIVAFCCKDHHLREPFQM